MPGWNYADIWEQVAERIPDAPALVQGDLQRSWAAFDRRADGIAKHLLDAGVNQQDKIAIYLYNCPEYLEAMYGAFKISLVPVNTNYRYTLDELVYLWDNSDSVAVVFHGSFVPVIDKIRDRVEVKVWLWVDDGTNECPTWATPFEDAATCATERTAAPWARDGDDLNFMYTGGTTGMPKGVMWRQDDLIRATLGGVNPAFRVDGDAATVVAESVNGPGLKQTPACPLMHGTGQFTSLIFLSMGGCIVLMQERTFDVEELLDAVTNQKLNALAIVGDAFAKPMLKALDAEPGRWDLSSLITITSSGVMWSEEVKQGLLKHHPGMMLVDAFSSSEAIGLGQSVSTAGGAAKTAKFLLGENSKVIADDGTEVQPGDGRRGKVAVRGFTPIGYYKDPEKTASTFIRIGDETYSMPGDYAMVEADGTLVLLGRGSVCINTGGEKVFPEEVEEVLKLHQSVHDAVVVGLPDDKWGQSVNAVVQLWPEETLDADALISHVKQHLAAFKAPKQVVQIDTIGRAPNAKVDYKRLTAYAADQLGITLPS
jgi:fatty-acyl-CoA synthase